jgi:tRNA threonylcarbamoyladenosine biosynthesis protein TsaB
MLVLGMDTATRTASIGLAEKNKVIGEFSLQVDRVHSAKLMPMVDQLLTAAGLDTASIEAVAVSAGPGSFTGLRIGMATAKGLAYALSVPLIGVSTLAGLCYNLVPSEAVLCPILDARMDEYYAAVYRWQNGHLSTIADDAVMGRNQLVEMLDGQKEPKIIVADAVLETVLNLNEALSGSMEYAQPHQVIARGASIALLGHERIENGAEDSILTLQPAYLRRSQAEILFGEKGRA